MRTEVPWREDVADDRTGPDLVAWAARILREQAMPLDEIEIVLATPDPEIVRRHMELHRERLAEWLAAQRDILSAIEPRLARRAADRSRRGDES